MEDIDFETENYWEDDLYQFNLAEADDYRHEADSDEEYEDNPEPWEAEEDWERDD